MRYIIEPHADDAFLSLGGHIEQWVKAGEEVIIVTVYSKTANGKRGREAEAYAAAIGARWEGLGLVESGSSKTETPEEAPVLKALQWFANGARFLDGVDAEVFTPLAIRHTEHKLVTRCVCMAFRSFRISRYLDQPYATIGSNSPEVTVALEGLTIQSFLKPHSRKYRHIPLFKTQSKFFYFNPAESLKNNIELIVSNG